MSAPRYFRFLRPCGTFTFPVPSDAMVQLFRDEAAQAGDLESVAVCDRALSGTARSRSTWSTARVAALRTVAGWLCDAEAAAMAGGAK